VANNNWAKLRTVTAALKLRKWKNKGRELVVGSTNLQRVVFDALKSLATSTISGDGKAVKTQHVASRDL
jgi:hypothetical protein